MTTAEMRSEELNQARRIIESMTLFVEMESDRLIADMARGQFQEALQVHDRGRWRFYEAMLVYFARERQPQTESPEVPV